MKANSGYIKPQISLIYHYYTCDSSFCGNTISLLSSLDIGIHQFIVFADELPLNLSECQDLKIAPLPPPPPPPRPRA